MMPEASDPAMPIACAIFSGDRLSAVATAAAAAGAPSTAVGWKHALWIASGVTRLMRHISSRPAGDALLHVGAHERAMLRDREHRGNDHRARMHRPAFERVVVVLAVRGRAVDERRVVGTERAL